MDDRDELPPQNPEAPAPPRPEWLRAVGRPPASASSRPPGSTPPAQAPLAGASPASGLTPMMDFFQRRVEALEKDLAVERERALMAQNLLSQQEALKSEVDSHLRALTDQLRREKAEREGDEARSRSQGRVDALEKRLDEMHRTFADLLRDAVAAREAAPGVDAALARRLDQLSSRFAETLTESERRQELERQRQEERMARLAREQEQGRAARETELGAALTALAGKLDAIQDGGRGEAAGLAALHEALERVARQLQTTPKAKDELIAALEEEKEDLRRALRDRHEILRRYSEERRAAEKSLEEGVAAAHAQLDEERARASAAEVRAAEHKGALSRLETRVAELEKALQEREERLVSLAAERDQRLLSLAAERDQLVRSLVAESEKVRAGLASRAEAEEHWNLRARELQAKLEAETARRQDESGALSDLRLKLAAVTEQMARALQERDATVARFADWDADRRRLLDALKQKDEMVSMLTAAFHGALGAPPKPPAP